ncbi:MAG: MarR family transcriptional regulator [Gluconacetobacter diazotrophicus]|nr:MarR family transcriptional regulator [Gluconacetobacter diazotrophicus]
MQSKPFQPSVSAASPGENGGAGTAGLFLREEQMRLAQDLFFLAWRDLAGAVDPVLAEAGLGRAHHRALHFVGRHPEIPVGVLLRMLGITKQSLARVLGELTARGMVEQAAGRRDRRQRLLQLTERGAAFERTLFEQQRERLLAAYREAGAGAVDGFRRVMRGIMAPDTRELLGGPPEAGAPRRPAPGEFGAGSRA